MLGIPQRSGYAPRPIGLSGLVVQQVLTYFDLDMRQAARLAMARNGVVGLVTDEIGLVIGDAQIVLTPQHVEHQAGKTAVAIVQYRGVHLPPHASEDVGHAVLGYQNGGARRRQPLIQQRAYMIVIGIENLAAASGNLLVAQADIAADLDRFTDRRDR